MRPESPAPSADTPSTDAAGAATASTDTAPSPLIDVVILAGGTARRLGGHSKPAVVARGARLLDHLLEGLAQLRREGLPLRRICVVAPSKLALPDGVVRALEDPPLGGPVAGIAAGIHGLAETGGAELDGGAALTAVLACDAPQSWRALPRLADALSLPTDLSSATQGAVIRSDKQVQYLLGLYRTDALAQVVAPGGRALRDVPVRRILGSLNLTHLPAAGAEAHDLDTWEEVRAWDRGAPTA